MAMILNGKQVAAEIRAELKTRAEALRKDGTIPCLAVLLAGDDPASKIYVRNKKRACEEIGIESRELLFPESVTEEELIAQIRALNADPAVDAMLVQLPLPKHINEARVLAEIAPEKDADGFHVVNAGRLFTGQTSVLPCTPAGCMELLRRAMWSFPASTPWWWAARTSSASPWPCCCSMSTAPSPSAIRARRIWRASPATRTYSWPRWAAPA